MSEHVKVEIKIIGDDGRWANVFAGIDLDVFAPAGRKRIQAAQLIVGELEPYCKTLILEWLRARGKK